MAEMPIGYAVSDCNPREKILANLLESLNPLEAVELQPELGYWNIEQAIDQLKACPFRTVHAPTRDLDLSTPYTAKHELAIRRTLEQMDLAARVDAHLFVIHAVHAGYPLDFEERYHRRRVFLNTYRKVLVPYYRNNKHQYQFCVENIEYSKFPATLHELIQLQDDCFEIQPVGLVLDVPHIWNTRRMIFEDESLIQEFGDTMQDHDLVQHVSQFIDRHLDRISLFHLANFGVNPIRTHDPITPTTIHPELKAVLPKIRERPVILEVYNGPVESLVESYHTVKQLIGQP